MKYIQSFLFIVVGISGTLVYQAFQNPPEKFPIFTLAAGSSLPNKVDVPAVLVRTPATKPGEWLVVVKK